MPTRLTLLVACALVVTACSSDGPPQSLAKACQLKACECLAHERSLFSRTATADIQWQVNGDAQCPPGYTLRLADE